MNKIYSLVVVGFLIGCGGNSGDDNTQTQIQSKAITVYNHAYNENYDADNIDDIISEAKNSYILVDPFISDINSNNISQMIENDNQVSGYISIGTGEDYREDYNQLKPFLVTKSWDEWEGEYFVSLISDELISIMKTRIDKMYNLGIKWVEFDNMDWADDDSVRDKYGSSVTKNQSIDYYNTLCDYLHQKDMKCMAKSTVDGADNFDGVTYESYDNKKNWWDRDGTKSFLDKDKLVIIIHYNESNCDDVYDEYKNLYDSNKISFICEDIKTKGYIHF